VNHCKNNKEHSMPTQIKEVRPPHGLTRLMLRFPIWLFRMHLGWIVGERFLLLTHTGRSSGLLRQTILEVQQHETASDAYYVSSGWGDKADWLRNVEKTPEVMITVGRRHVHARAERLGSEEAERAILEYAKRNPLAIRVLPRLMGTVWMGAKRISVPWPTWELWSPSVLLQRSARRQLWSNETYL
jgi:deazaflavin-dependent oxidoreductase (nitroreductase family)